MEQKSQDSIQVCIRIRPDQDEQTIVQYTEKQVHLDKNHFGFDKIFPPSSNQDDIFQNIGHKVIKHTLDGYNGCIFVYGQTGSGKTYTMMGDNNGIMQKSFVELFSEIQSHTDTQCIISCSYYEIYNEQIIDLLDHKRQKKLNIRQDVKKGIIVQNLTQESVYSSHKLLECLGIGMKNRHVGETMMNRESSRSHSIFTISLSMKTEINGHKVLKTPKLHFVDLAGSERQKMTASSGQRLKQAGNINKSLTTLGMVINALTGQKTRSHIPYRDSKLTNLLRDSLGGNSKTFLIATISRSVLCFQETLSTLNFANRAKMVKVKAQINQQSLSTNIELYKQQIRRLKTQISKLKTSNPSSNTKNYMNNGNLTPQVQQWLMKSAASLTPQNINFDSHFRQINQKISAISEHITKNAGSPSMEQLIQQIKKYQPIPLSSNPSEQMVDQNEQSSQQVLVTYLSSNNTLLQKIHTKIDQYLVLKQQLRSTAFHQQMHISQLKTPSKFQRDQYQQLLQNRCLQIQELHQQLKQQNKTLLQQQLQVTELRQHKSQTLLQQDQLVIKYQEEVIQLKKQICNLKSILTNNNQQMQSNYKKLQEMAQINKQNKQLYLYAEQNYQTEKQMRKNIEENLLNKLELIQQMKQKYQSTIQEVKQHYQQQMQVIKQQNVELQAAVQFTNIALKKQNQQNTNLVSNIKQLQHVSKQYRQLNNSNCLHKINSILENQDITKKNRQLLVIVSNKLIIQQISQNQQYQLKQELSHINQQMQTIIDSNQQKQQQYQYQQASYNNKIDALLYKINEQDQNHQGELMKLKAEHNKQLEQNYKQIQQKQQYYQQQLSVKQQQLIKYLEQLTMLSQKLQQKQKQLTEIINKYQQQQEQNKNAIKQYAEDNIKMKIQVQEFRKTHKQIIKQNYRLKSKYGSSHDNNSQNKTNQQQLTSKVQYYQEKFKLMTMQYQKAVEVVNKIKQKQLKYLQKIAYLEENIKVKSSQIRNYQGQSRQQLIAHNRLVQNQLELTKTKLLKVTYPKKQSQTQQTNNTSSSHQISEKQQYFRQLIINSISRWDKENINDSSSDNNKYGNKSLEQLIKNWEQLETESTKKVQAVTKGIKKQQKIKAQNNLIVKQNIYLKEQVTKMEREMGQNLGATRKIMKMDREYERDSMQF